MTKNLKIKILEKPKEVPVKPKVPRIHTQSCKPATMETSRIDELESRVVTLTSMVVALQTKLAEKDGMKIPFSLIRSFAEKGAKRRWKKNPQNTEPDFLSYLELLKWCQKYE